MYWYRPIPAVGRTDWLSLSEVSGTLHRPDITYYPREQSRNLGFRLKGLSPGPPTRMQKDCSGKPDLADTEGPCLPLLSLCSLEKQAVVAWVWGRDNVRGRQERVIRYAADIKSAHRY